MFYLIIYKDITINFKTMTDDEILKIVPKRIKLLRRASNLTQQKIADQLGITMQMYSRYELGQTRISVAHLKTLCDIYNINITHILDDKLDFTLNMNKKGTIIIEKKKVRDPNYTNHEIEEEKE